MLSNLYLRELRIKQPPNEDAGNYVFALPVVKQLQKQGGLQLNKPVTFLVGENGSGKSTLLEAVAVASGFNAEGGTKNFHFASNETHSPLHRVLSVVKGVKLPADGFFLRAESFYNVATEIERLNLLDPRRPLLYSYGGKSLHHQSHGESFMSLVAGRFGGNGLYLLDEPEAALSPLRQMTLLSSIAHLVRQNSQLIIATHSPILLAYPDADIYVLSQEGIALTAYKETEHYRLTRQFLENPQQMLRYLLAEEEPDEPINQRRNPVKP